MTHRPHVMLWQDADVDVDVDARGTFKSFLPIGKTSIVTMSPT